MFRTSLFLSTLLLLTFSLSAQQLTYGWSFGGQGVFNKISQPLPGEQNASQFGLNGRVTAGMNFGERMRFEFGVEAALINYGQESVERPPLGQTIFVTREIESKAGVFYVGIPLSLKYYTGTERSGPYLRSGLRVLVPLSVKTSASLLRSNPATGRTDRETWPAGGVKTQVPTVIGELGLGFQLPGAPAYFEFNAGYTLTPALDGIGGRSEGIPNYLSSSRALLAGVTIGSYFGGKTNDD